jgi:calcineurin-like phosphoesterase family protein
MTIDTYYWSDPHFGHRNVIEYEKRPFADITEMNETMIANYNSVVGANDRCVWVGDCFLTGIAQAQQIMERLNGIKIVVLGNHDKRPNQMLKAGFAFACYEMKVKIAGYDVLISHYPYADETDTRHETKYQDRRPLNTGLWLIHGHSHSNGWGKFKDRMVNVGVDLWGFTPVSQDSIAQHIQKSACN